MKKALITGITGQDGSYLADLLLEKGYEVHGLVRRNSNYEYTPNIAHIRDRIHLHYGDLGDSANLRMIMMDVKPDEVYNLAAQSHVHVSFELPEFTAEVDAVGVMRILEAVRMLNNVHPVKFYQASTSEMFGKVQQVPQNENTPFYPRSPYGVAKLYGHWITVNYREAYNMYACNGILFNHESPQRGETFVTRKISRATAKIVLGLEDCLYLGNLNSERDWGHAKDYIEGMWLILQQEKPEDFVLATGVTTTIREFVRMAFEVLGIELGFKGEGENEQGFVISCSGDFQLEIGRIVVKVDKKYFRPTEVDLLLGDPSKAMNKLGWKPKYDLNSLVSEMVKSDVKLFSK